VPGPYKLIGTQLAARLANGNTLVNNWSNNWWHKVDVDNLPDKAMTKGRSENPTPKPLPPANRRTPLDLEFQGEEGHNGLRATRAALLREIVAPHQGIIR
jgi:hypothetical protein